MFKQQMDGNRAGSKLAKDSLMRSVKIRKESAGVGMTMRNALALMIVWPPHSSHLEIRGKWIAVADNS